MRLARLLVVAALGSLATPGLAQDACGEVKLALDNPGVAGRPERCSTLLAP